MPQSTPDIYIGELLDLRRISEALASVTEETLSGNPGMFATITCGGVSGAGWRSTANPFFHVGKTASFNSNFPHCQRKNRLCQKIR